MKMYLFGPEYSQFNQCLRIQARFITFHKITNILSQIFIDTPDSHKTQRFHSNFSALFYHFSEKYLVHGSSPVFVLSIKEQITAHFGRGASPFTGFSGFSIAS